LPAKDYHSCKSCSKSLYIDGTYILQMFY